MKQKYNKLALGWLLGTTCWFGTQAFAQVVSDNIEQAQVIQPIKQDFRVMQLMASTSVDSLTATKMLQDSDDTKKITDRLDRMILLLDKLNRKK